MSDQPQSNDVTTVVVAPIDPSKPNEDQKSTESTAPITDFKVPPRVMSAKGRALAYTARGASWLGFSSTFSVHKDEIMELAAKSLALNAPGLTDQAPFLARIKCFLDGLDVNSIPPLSRMILNNTLTGFMRSRLRLTEYISAHPDIVKQELKPMLVITGLPRTGTTVLQKTLACDPKARTIMMWEAFSNVNIVPPSTSHEQSVKTDPRIRECQEQMDAVTSIFPEYWNNVSQSHHMEPAEPDEEVLALYMGAVLTVHIIRSNEAYKQDIFADDNDDGNSPYSKKDVYQLLHVFYQMLQSGYSPESHWVLKSPYHALYLNDLEREFPQAKLIFTHRDPKQTVASYCALQEAFIAHLYEDGAWDRRDIGKFCLEFLSLFTKRSLRWQKKTDPKNYFNVDYLDVVKTPVETITKIYEHFNMGTPSEEAISAMKQWAIDNPQGKHGRKKYSLQEFGLTEEQIETEFKEYYDFLKTYKH